MKRKITKVLTLVLILSLALPMSVSAGVRSQEIQATVNFTILHTNDFHGNLEPAGSNPGAARVAQKIVDVETEVGADKVLVFDAGDMMQGTLLSNITKGIPTIDYYSTIGYDLTTFGNHEFDWGQDTLADRATDATFPMVAANIVQKVDDSCAGWDRPVLTGTDGVTTYTIEPYEVFTIGTAPDEVQIGVIGVGSVETPYITIAEATQGLCFKDPYESIVHYYDDMLAEGADVLVVVSHNGWTDGGYGYGFTVYGDQTLAKKLNDGGYPVSLIIGGHSHTDVTTPFVYGETTVVQAHYSGRKVGRADFTYDTATGDVTVAWTRIVVGTSDTQYQPIVDLINGYVSDEEYQELINQPVGYAQVDLLRDYNGDSMMSNFIQDALYNQLNSDADPANDIDMFFNNAGGLRIDWCDLEDPLNPGTYIWTSTAADCQKEGLWSHDPMELTYGMMFQILPFGNQTVIGDMTGAQIIELLNQSATLFKGALASAGIRHKFYSYTDALPGPQPWAWGAYDIEVYNKAADEWEPIDPDTVYRVATNNFLAPAGQDGYTPFKYLQPDIYLPDMLDTVIEWVSANHATPETAYKGPNGDGLLDGRVTRNGTSEFTGDPTEVVPITILHHNDAHGNLVKGPYVAYPQLVTLINQARAHNPQRTLLLNGGDTIQGDAMMKFFMTAAMGYSVDGTPLPPALQVNPIIKAFNLVGYDAMVIGNHEYNFGKDVFVSTLKDAAFPILQANVEDTGEYGIDQVPVKPYEHLVVGPEAIKVDILGIGNHRVVNYELPSNIPGLSFPNPIATAASWAPELDASSDLLIALTHIGFTEDPKSVEVDENVDTNLAATVDGIDVIIGSHSHTNPATGFGDYKYLPAIVGAPDGDPVLVTQAYRYNNTLGSVVVGMLPDDSGLQSASYKVVSRAGRYESVSMDTPEDPEVKSLIQPYADLLAAYQATPLGETIIPIDSLQAYTQETNGANLQADAAVWKLEDELTGVDVDFHLSGAMSNRKVANTATPATPVMLTIADMYTAMPYENSLVVMSMNGPQIKAILERAYRNYYYYKYVPGYGGYSYYTTCMIDINAGGKITYADLYPALPSGNNVVSLEFDGKKVDFTDASTFYNVSTVNYLAAGSCNFNDGGVTLWPLDQIVADTQFYVRDSVIDYIKYLVDLTGEPINPQIEGRLQFVQLGESLWLPGVFK